MNRQRSAAAAVLVVCLLLGWYAAAQLGGFLAISFHEKPLPAEDGSQPLAPSAEPEPVAPVAAIVLPAGTATDELYRAGAAELADALALRTGVRPTVLEAAHRLPAGRAVRVGNSDPAHAAADPESFALRAAGEELIIAGAGRQAEVYGMVHLASLLAAGLGDTGLARLDTVVAPALRYRFVDLGGVGIVPDPAAWRVDDYSHHNRAFQHVIRADAPYVDSLALAEVQQQFREYALRMALYGYNGIIVPGFLQFVNFDRVGSGLEVYDEHSDYRHRHLALRRAYGEMFRYAHGLGLSIVLNTDMLALTEPLERYFAGRFGGIDVADPAVWEVYRLGLAELFEAFPAVEGVMIRIGEAGTVYNLEGWNYYSELHVRSDTAVQAMLRAFDEVATAHDRRLFFRTWTVGVGEVGDLHTNPRTYERVLGGLELPGTVFSTKFVTGDFYSYLPVNPTLFVGRQPRIVELQARREFEGFAAFPNYLGPLHQRMLREIRGRNPQVDGIWLWTQEGGPPRAGPWSLYPFHGFWQLVDADVYVGARLAWDPDADMHALTRAWVRRTFGPDPAVVERLAEVLLRSREPVLEGLYIGEFARREVRALGLEPPPMLWIFEWDILTGSSAVLSAIYYTSRDNLAGAIAEGFAAVEKARRLQALAREVDRAAVSRPEVYDRLLASLAYEVNLLETLAWYRQAFLSHYRWLDTGDAAAYRAWRSAHARFDTARSAHLAAYGEDLDFPAFSFFDAEVGMAHAERGVAMMWLARLLLGMTLLGLLLGSRPLQRRTPDFPGKRGFAALWTAVVSPWNLQRVAGPAPSPAVETAATTTPSRPAPTENLAGCGVQPAKAGFVPWRSATPTGLLQPRLQSSGGDMANALVVGVWPLAAVMLAHLTFSAFLSPAYAVLVGLALVCSLAVLLTLNRGRSPFALLASFHGPLLLWTCLLLGVLAVRGPLYFWYGFWIRDGLRVALFSLGAAAFGWLLFAVYTTLRGSYGRSAPGAIGQLLLGLGAPLLAIAGLLQLLGLERALTVLNDQLALLPMGLSRILGITTHLNIPLDLPLYGLGLGALLAAGGWLLHLLASRRQPPGPGSDSRTGTPLALPHPRGGAEEQRSGGAGIRA